jgi:hypothetical protein
MPGVHRSLKLTRLTPRSLPRRAIDARGFDLAEGEDAMETTLVAIALVVGFGLFAIARRLDRIAHFVSRIGDLTRAIEQLSQTLETASGVMAQRIQDISGKFQDISGELKSIAESVAPRSLDHEPKPEPWQVENEKRDELRKLIQDLDPPGFTQYLSDRYRLRVHDPWVTRVASIRDHIGVEAAITEIRKKDTEIESSLKLAVR